MVSSEHHGEGWHRLGLERGTEVYSELIQSDSLFSNWYIIDTYLFLAMDKASAKRMEASGLLQTILFPGTHP
jgi:hypothetical protein